MNVTSYLQFGDNVSGLYNKEYLVVEVHTHFRRSSNSFHPDSPPECESLDITVIAPDKSDLELQEWYVSNSFRTGRLVFNLVDQRSNGDEEVTRVIEFNEAQCYSLGERYDILGGSLRFLDLKIKTRSCKVTDVSFN